MHSFILPFILALGIPLASAVLGLDGSNHSISTSDFACLKNEGYSFYISRVWLPKGAYDSVGIKNIKNAWAAGMSHVDAYISPCLKDSCASPANQVEAALNKLLSEGAADIGQVWLEVSDHTLWPNDQDQNRQIITDMANRADSLGYSVGIFTTEFYWETFMGADWTEMSKYHLWWSRENANEGFSGFPAFGGWSKPNIHQFAREGKSPCISIKDKANLNWYP